MEKEFEYFKDFLEDPGSYNVREFFEWVHEWAQYLTTHKDEFNYLEDEEWREIRERLIAAFEVKEDLRLEFEDLSERLEAFDENTSDQDRIDLYRDWLEFMKRNQAEYEFTDEQIAGSEIVLNNFKQSVRKSEIAEENLRKSTIELQKSIDELDEALFEHYERTGKRPILTSLHAKKKISGN